MAYTTLSYNCIAAYILRFLLIRSEYLKIVKICCNSILSDVKPIIYFNPCSKCFKISLKNYFKLTRLYDNSTNFSFYLAWYPYV